MFSKFPFVVKASQPLKPVSNTDIQFFDMLRTAYDVCVFQRCADASVRGSRSAGFSAYTDGHGSCSVTKFADAD